MKTTAVRNIVFPKQLVAVGVLTVLLEHGHGWFVDPPRMPSHIFVAIDKQTNN